MEKFKRAGYTRLRNGKIETVSATWVLRPARKDPDAAERALPLFDYFNIKPPA